jgi:acyl carrier protein
MGLDAIELVMRVEDEFCIDISDAEAGEVAAVGNLHDLVIH